MEKVGRIKARYPGPTNPLGAAELHIDGHTFQPGEWLVVALTEAILKAAAVGLLELLTIAEEAIEEATEEARPRRPQRRRRRK